MTDQWWVSTAADSQPDMATVAGSAAPEVHGGHGSVRHVSPGPARPTLAARSGANAVVIGLVGGLVAGAVGVGVGAAFTESSDYAPGVIVGASASVLGFVLHGWERLSAGYVGRGASRGAVGAIIGAGAGLAGLGIADWLYQSADRDSGSGVETALVIGWLVIGVLAGGGIGVLSGIEKVISGVLGGALGGGAGGVLFVALDGSRTADRAMLIGVLVAASTLGVALGGAERLRRQLWIEVIDGPLAGRELILYGADLTIGSDPSCDIALPGDRALEPLHARLRIQRGAVVLDDLAADALVDGHRFAGGLVPMGSTVGLGSTFFRIRSRQGG